MVAATLDTFVLKPGYKKVFIAFDGVMPTKTQLEEKYVGSDLSLDQLVSLGAGNVRGYFIYDTDFVAKKIRSNMIRWESSLREEPVTIEALGDVSWFIFAVVDPTVESINEASVVYHAYVGDITDIYEGGDVEILDKKLGANQNYLVNDIEITFKV